MTDSLPPLTGAADQNLPVRARLRSDLLAAMKARDAVAVNALRTVLAAIDNAEAVEPPEGLQPSKGLSVDVPRLHLTEEDILSIVKREIGDRRRNHAQYVRLGRVDEARILREELELLSRYG